MVGKKEAESFLFRWKWVAEVLMFESMFVLTSEILCLRLKTSVCSSISYAVTICQKSERRVFIVQCLGKNVI